MEDKNKKMDYKTLNEIFKTGNILLKIILAISILAVAVLTIYLIDKINLLSIIFKIFSLISPLFIGVALAWLLEPCIDYFVKNKVGRKLSTSVVYLTLIFLIILILALIVPEFISQLNELMIKLPDFLKEIVDFINNIFAGFSASDFDFSNIKNNLIDVINNLFNNITDGGLTGVVNKVGSSLKVLLNVVLGLLIAFYLSLDFTKVDKYLNLLVPKKFAGEAVELKKSLNDMLRNYVSGTLLSCLFVMLLSLIGFLISGVSSPLLFAAFCAITNIIPYFGPYIGGIPVVIVGFAISPFTGIVCLITVIIVQFLEGNILHPLIVGKAVSLHPITMMLSLLVFEYFFGIVGMILAAPIVATLKIVCLFLDSKYHFLEKIKI